MALENNRMRQPTMAMPAPTQKRTQSGPGFAIGNAIPPMTKPMVTTTVPTQDMGLPGLCSRWLGSCASAPAVPVPSTVPVACSATTPPPTLDLPMLRLSRKYRNEVRDSVAGPHLAYDGSQSLFAEPTSDERALFPGVGPRIRPTSSIRKQEFGTAA